LAQLRHKAHNSTAKLHRILKHSSQEVAQIILPKAITLNRHKPWEELTSRIWEDQLTRFFITRTMQTALLLNFSILNKQLEYNLKLEVEHQADKVNPELIRHFNYQGVLNSRQFSRDLILPFLRD
jgi:hypothetical protein